MRSIESVSAGIEQEDIHTVFLLREFASPHANVQAVEVRCLQLRVFGGRSSFLHWNETYSIAVDFNSMATEGDEVDYVRIATLAISIVHHITQHFLYRRVHFYSVLRLDKEVRVLPSGILRKQGLQFEGTFLTFR